MGMAIMAALATATMLASISRKAIRMPPNRAPRTPVSAPTMSVVIHTYAVYSSGLSRICACMRDISRRGFGFMRFTTAFPMVRQQNS
ncbi:hypothetical protein DSECCO2_603410 [anaerobic digester metagenome]